LIQTEKHYHKCTDNERVQKARTAVSTHTHTERSDTP
jgi:hypothetical protein